VDERDTPLAPSILNEACELPFLADLVTRLARVVANLDGQLVHSLSLRGKHPRLYEFLGHG
jgi:hypothetical protein